MRIWPPAPLAMPLVTLSAFWRCLSSSRTTSLVPATGAHPPDAALLGGAEVPEEPALPHPATRPAVATSPTRPRATRETVCIVCCLPSVSRRRRSWPRRVSDGSARYRAPNRQLPSRLSYIRRGGAGTPDASGAPQRPRVDEPFDHGEGTLDQQRQPGHQQAARDHLAPPDGQGQPEPLRDDLAEPTARDQRGEGGGRDDLDRGGTEAGRQVRHRQRQLHPPQHLPAGQPHSPGRDRKSTRLNSSHVKISYAVFCLQK